ADVVRRFHQEGERMPAPGVVPLLSQPGCRRDRLEGRGFGLEETELLLADLLPVPARPRRARILGEGGQRRMGQSHATRTLRGRRLGAGDDSEAERVALVAEQILLLRRAQV